MGFSQGVSGLNAASTGLDTIGNNIANSQTVGFKSSRSEFADLYAGAKAGLGVTVADTNQNFSDGSLKNTGRNLDLAIDGGGFFRMAKGNQVEYSRDGQFQQTKDGNLANSSGALLTGYNVSNFNNPGAAAKVVTSGTPQTITLPSEGLNARATSKASLAAALDSGAKVPTDPFDPTKPSTYNWSNPTTVYDSLGNAHTLNQFFSKLKTDSTSNTSTWQVNSQIETGSGLTSLDSFDLQFGPAGNLNQAYPDGGTPSSNGGSSSVNYTVSAPDLGNGAAPLDFDFDFAGTSQTAQDFSAGNPSQDGYASGSLTGVSIQNDGKVRGSYSNGQSVDLAQIALAGFANDQGLEPVSGNAWLATSASGQPSVGTPGSGKLGSLRGKTLEQSNVDLSKQLVAMIVAQRNYQANAQTIKTQSEVLQTAVNLR